MSRSSYHTSVYSETSWGHTGRSQGYRRPPYLVVELKVARNGFLQDRCSPEVLDDPRMSSLVRELEELMRAHQRGIEAIHRPSRVTVDQRASRRQYERRMRYGVPHPSGRIYQDAGHDLHGAQQRSHARTVERDGDSYDGRHEWRPTHSAGVRALKGEQRNLRSKARSRRSSHRASLCTAEKCSGILDHYPDSDLSSPNANRPNGEGRPRSALSPPPLSPIL